MTSFPYIGAELAHLREMHGMSPRDLAHRLGLRETTILNLEKGRFFKPDAVGRILACFKCRLAVIPVEDSGSIQGAATDTECQYTPSLPGTESWRTPQEHQTEPAGKHGQQRSGRKPIRLTCLEICAGAGGQALGLEMAGFEHTALVEYESDYCEALRKNRPGWNVICGDVRNFSGRPFEGKIDLLAGGVPCPPFSKAGRQLGSEDERDLFPEAIRLISEIRPKAVMLENVRGFLDPVFRNYRESILSQISAAGYKVTIKLLHSSDYGVPQLRPRVVIVGIRNDMPGRFTYPEPATGTPPTVAAAILDLMKAGGWREADAWAKEASKIAPTVVGGSKKHGGPDLGPARARRAWSELGIDGTGVASEPPPPDFTGLPRLTPRMIARIQGFPDEWQFAPGKTKSCRMIGNAFPPPVAKAVGIQIMKALGEK